MILYLFIVFLVLSLADFSLSCSSHPPCGPNIDIHPPFFTDINNTGCDGSYLIYCDDDQHPTINFKDKNQVNNTYIVKNISYSDSKITLFDPRYTNFFRDSVCNSLYNFTHPLPHFENATHPILDDAFFDNCALWETYTPAPNNSLHNVYNFSICKDYDIYYDTTSELLQYNHCRLHLDQPLSFEWRLSFANWAADGLSALSAGFSADVKLRPECYNKSWCTTGRIPIIKNKNSKRMMIIITGACAAGGVIALIAACCYVICCYRSRRKYLVLSKLLTWSMPLSSSYNTRDPDEANYQTHIFSYEELEVATGSFSHELGAGGFGSVYKGKLRDGRTVAVKRIYQNNSRKLEQFMNEVDILSRVRHQNLVILYGCTSRRSRELLLVYEFVSNGTLAEHLHGPRAVTQPLPWHRRMSIALEIAEALTYLHSIEPQIIHRDVKTTNILLDSNFVVKVADFGLSRLFPLDVTHVSTAPQGTPGYVDPQYHQCYQLTDRSDVYSFGVVLVELISSKPAVDLSRDKHEINLANMALTKIQNSQFEQLVDPVLGYETDTETKAMMEQVAELAFTCLQLDREMRPSITEVLDVLRRITNKEDDKLLMNIVSPDSVAEKWHSISTTPSTSTEVMSDQKI